MRGQHVIQNNIEERIICPIGHMRMTDPVIASDGHTYERANIEEWFNHKYTSPITGVRLTSRELRINYALKSIIELFEEADKQARELSEAKETVNNLKQTVEQKITQLNAIEQQTNQLKEEFEQQPMQLKRAEQQIQQLEKEWQILEQQTKKLEKEWQEAAEKVKKSRIEAQQKVVQWQDAETKKEQLNNNAELKAIQLRGVDARKNQLSREVHEAIKKLQDAEKKVDKLQKEEDMRTLKEQEITKKLQQADEMAKELQKKAKELQDAEETIKALQKAEKKAREAEERANELVRQTEEKLKQQERKQRKSQSEEISEPPHNEKLKSNPSLQDDLLALYNKRLKTALLETLDKERKKEENDKSASIKNSFVFFATQDNSSKNISIEDLWKNESDTERYRLLSKFSTKKSSYIYISLTQDCKNNFLHSTALERKGLAGEEFWDLANESKRIYWLKAYAQLSNGESCFQPFTELSNPLKPFLIEELSKKTIQHQKINLI